MGTRGPKTIELDDSQPFTPETGTPEFVINVKAINMFNHTCADHFPESVSGCTLAVPALTYSPTILEYVMRAYNGRGGLAITFSEADIATAIHYTKKTRPGKKASYFVKDLASIYWLKETLEENNLLVIAKGKNGDSYALYLNEGRFDKFSKICKFLRVRLVLDA